MLKVDIKERHELLMKNLNHYLWNVPYNKWTEQDYENLKNGISNGYVKPRGNTGCLSPVALIDEKGTTTEYKSIADASRKTGVNASTIYAAVNGRAYKRKRNSKHTKQWIRL